MREVLISCAVQKHVVSTHHDFCLASQSFRPNSLMTKVHVQGHDASQAGSCGADRGPSENLDNADRVGHRTMHALSQAAPQPSSATTVGRRSSPPHLSR